MRNFSGKGDCERLILRRLNTFVLLIAMKQFNNKNKSGVEIALRMCLHIHVSKP